MPVRLRIDCAYDGSGFSGWARQPGLASVQGTLEGALAVLSRGGASGLTVAGRTDAGVHARGQVTHADVPTGSFTGAPGRSGRSPEEAFARRLNALIARDRSLPQPDVVVRAVRVAPPGFDARFSASWRRYVYRIADSVAPRDPLTRGSTLWSDRRLDVDAMDRAAAVLLGEHDFLSFCRPRPGATTTRTVLDARVRRIGGVVEVEMRADAFCHSMVRSVVGALLTVGEGRRDSGWVAEVLQARNHDAMRVAPPHGLTLEEVGYPVDSLVAQRATAARARRAQPSSSSASNTNSPESSSRSPSSSESSSASSSTSDVKAE
ncbi:MAG: tRNA pseudouridine(38-40) synthase TruA [Actinomycetes bacterium]|nr:tRNA pseudouridine(38-40) synthase TruA [Actinomycetes bacterium]MDX5379892.1 tRNA pseudouridine(38-40) synthase TruA [Actinomycetes bacterium]MDX5398377.1 tRNA pseudouridine(38-40) synthase TruA [Actinomycetes bacterium]MDX5449601.1 tRNA pseudouridine(38-40) synthase TruA [Actinomycetes bacterium]